MPLVRLLRPDIVTVAMSELLWVMVRLFIMASIIGRVTDIIIKRRVIITNRAIIIGRDITNMILIIARTNAIGKSGIGDAIMVAGKLG